MKLTPLPTVIADIQAGKIVVMIDDEDREDEGDLVMAAQFVTPEAINFMIRQGKGLICVSLADELVRTLQLPLQVTDNRSSFGTNFTVSIDHRSVSSHGVSASARATTITQVLKDDALASEFISPGYVFPLRAVPEGVLKRRGQTEGSVELARIAGLKPAGVICEIMNDAGQMIRGKELEEFCLKHHLSCTSVEAMVQYRRAHEKLLTKVAECTVTDLSGFGIELDEAYLRSRRFSQPLASQPFAEPLQVIVYLDAIDSREHIAFVKGQLRNGCLVRIHSECLTGDVFESKRCDCGEQLENAFAQIFLANEGVIIYLAQEGRDIGFADKLRAYELQDQGLDTVDANLALGFRADNRDYRAGAEILRDLGLQEVRLLTNNPAKVRSLEESGIVVRERIGVSTTVHEHNRSYLKAKRDRLGHVFPFEL